MEPFMASAMGHLVAVTMLTVLFLTDGHAQIGAPSSSGPVSRTDISGIWFDSQLMSSRASIVQNGNEFSVTGTGVPEDGPLVGVQFSLSGNGHITGTSLDLNYSFHFQTGAAGVGHCSGVLRKDDVIAWHCRDSNAFESKPTWIRQ
jgi:hypothetical protein